MSSSRSGGLRDSRPPRGLRGAEPVGQGTGTLKPPPQGWGDPNPALPWGPQAPQPHSGDPPRLSSPTGTPQTPSGPPRLTWVQGWGLPPHVDDGVRWGGARGGVRGGDGGCGDRIRGWGVPGQNLGGLKGLGCARKDLSGGSGVSQRVVGSHGGALGGSQGDLGVPERAQGRAGGPGRVLGVPTGVRIPRGVS